MASKKTKEVPLDPELEAIKNRAVETIDDCKDAAKEAARYNARANQAQDSAQSFRARVAALAFKIISFARAHRDELPTENNRWQVGYGYVQFSAPGSAIEFKKGVTTDTVVANLRAHAKTLLKEAKIDVEDIIQTTDTVKFDDLRKIPAKFRRRLGYSIKRTDPDPRLIFAATDTKKSIEPASGRKTAGSID